MDEKAGPAGRCGLQKGGGRTECRHPRPRPERRDLPHLRLRRRPRGAVRRGTGYLRKDGSEEQRMAVGPAAALSGGVRGRRTVHFVVRRKECPRHRLACVGHRGLYHLPFLLHQAGGQILQGGQALQLGAEGRSLLEAHQTSDEVAGAAGRTGCPGGGRCDPQEPLLRLRRHPHLLGAESDSPPRRHHRCHRPGGLRQIHLWPGLPLRGPL